MKKVSIKEGFDKFRPEICVFVVSADAEGKPNGMVAAWNMKCSIEPPLFAVSLSKKGNTQKLVRESGEFVVAVPDKKLEEELLFFGSTHGGDVDKFAESEIGIQKAELVAPPLLKDATINFECEVFGEVDAGDHYVFIGKILAAHVNEDGKILLSTGRVNGKRTFDEF